MIRLKTTFILLALSFTLINTAMAHFPWLVRNEDGQAALFFGENPADRTYKLPSSIAKAEVNLLRSDAEPSKLKLNTIESDQFVGLVSERKIPEDGILAAQVTFGIYHGSRLDYYTLHRSGKLPSSRQAEQAQLPKMKLMAEAVDTDGGVDIYVAWDGKPLADAEVKLFCSEGHEEGAAKTDATGKVSFSDKQVEDGLNGIMVGHNAKDQAGKLDGQEYQSESHYLTLTFQDPQDFEKSPAASDSSATQTPQTVDYADLPVAITSFGAARVDNSIYVYGGHTGEAHSYSTEAQSNQLLKLDLQTPTKAWKRVAEGERLQGLALVAHGNRLICIGGFTALNAPDDEHKLHSQAAVRAFDTQTQTWSDLPSLPAGRSSHDAALIGTTIYVVGGWNMNDGEDTQWHSTALALDLSQANSQWTEIATPPFKRRALATVAHAGKLYVIGGMNEEGGATREVAVFHPAQNAWTTGAELVGEQGMEGFGLSAWSVDGRLIATTYSGAIQQLSSSGDSWTVIGKTRDARFFHRLLPAGERELISLGGANMEQHQKFLDPESISVEDDAVATLSKDGK